MKLISLNTFNGRFYPAMVEFITAHAGTTDFFVFQEILDYADTDIAESGGARVRLFNDLQAVLPQFVGEFAPVQNHFDGKGYTPQDIRIGNATYVNKKHAVTAVGDFLIYQTYNSFNFKTFDTLPQNAQYVRCDGNGKKVTVLNVHGSAWPLDKRDSPNRLEQTRRILEFVHGETGEIIICGDFNLLPDTESIRLFEKAGYRNLVTEYKIPTTRGSLIKKLHPEYGTSALGWQEFADYCFVSPGVTVKNFEVPDLPVSDHLPLILEFDV